MRKLITFFCFIILVSCQQEIEINIPPAPQQLVVEGYIEQGKNPVVIITKSQDYFDPIPVIDLNSITDSASLINVFSDIIVTDAQVEIISNQQAYPLQLQFNFETFPPITYTSSSLIGEENNTYKLNIYVGDDTITSSAHIPNLNPPDSIWFEFEENNDSLGYIKFRYSDPDTIGNCFRILAKREGVDNNFVPVLGPNRDDVIINGLSFDDYIYRGYGDDIEQEELDKENPYSFRLGDTITIKWLHMNREHFLFWYSVQNNNSGGPFQTPSSVNSNINRGLGIWGGQAANYITIIAE